MGGIARELISNQSILNRYQSASRRNRGRSTFLERGTPTVGKEGNINLKILII